jgi:hypothetical protein
MRRTLSELLGSFAIATITAACSGIDALGRLKNPEY